MSVENIFGFWKIYLTEVHIFLLIFLRGHQNYGHGALSSWTISSITKFCILYKKKLQRFVLDEDCLSPQEIDVCGVGKGQCHEIWILNSSHALPCNAHTMVDDKCCSKTDHSPDNLHYHKPGSASEQLVHQKALSSLIAEY